MSRVDYRQDVLAVRKGWAERSSNNNKINGRVSLKGLFVNKIRMDVK